MFRAIAFACLAVTFLYTPGALAHGRHHHHHYHHHHAVRHHSHHRVRHAWHRSGAVYAESGRPPKCPPILWCGCYLATKLGFHGHTWRELWVAKAWARIGRPAPHGCVNCVAVFSRRGGGHVGLVKSWDAHGNPVVLSGNYNNRVATAAHPASRLIALRWVGNEGTTWLN